MSSPSLWTSQQKNIRKRLIRHKEFLSQIYVGPSRTIPESISRASKAQLKVLCEILFLVGTGKIHLPKDTYESFQQSDAFKSLVNMCALGKKKDRNALLNDKEAMHTFLEQFIDHFHSILFYLFNK